MINEIKALRKKLHQNPELSGLETHTAALIKSFVEEHNPTTIIEKIGGNGIAVVYKFSDEGATVAIRCELDALPIEEANEFSHRSLVKGVSHKCGHDGHMSIVAGLIFWIKNQAFKTGKIVLLFQPAEETGEGAFKVIEDKRFLALNIDYFFALHNIPGKPLHHIIAIQKGFSAEVQSFLVELTGRECHAAEPENGINPAMAISEIVASLTDLNVSAPKDENFAILTPVHINMGQKSYGISPAKGELHYTIRTWTPESMLHLKLEIETIIERICQKYEVKFNFDWFEYFPATINDVDCNKMVIEAAKGNNFQLIESPYPFKFGEDFGWFSQRYRAAIFGIGAGEHTPVLHDATYDFPDEIIKTGMDMFQAIISKILND